MSSFLQHLAASIGMAFVVLMNAPFAAYFAVDYGHFMDEPFIHVRQPEPVFIQSILTVFTNLVTIPLLLIDTIVFPTPQNDDYLFAVGHALLFLMYTPFVYRAWMVFYWYKFEKELVSSRITGTPGFFKRHISTLGNRWYVAILVTLLSLLMIILKFVSCLESHCNVLTLHNKGALDSIAKLVPFVFVFIFPILLIILNLCQVQHVDDTLRIRSEFIPLLVAYVILICGKVFVDGVNMFGNFKGSKVYVATLIASSFWGTFCVFLQTKRVVQLWREYVLDNEAVLKTGPQKTVAEFCVHLHGYLSFLTFVSTLHASESLFFISEVVDYMRSYLPYVFEKHGAPRGIESLWNIAEDMPKSHIMKVQGWKTRFRLIYLLYVEYSSERCINVSYGTREAIIELYNKRFAMGVRQTSSKSVLSQEKISKFFRRLPKRISQIFFNESDASIMSRLDEAHERGYIPPNVELVPDRLTSRGGSDASFITSASFDDSKADNEFDLFSMAPPSASELFLNAAGKRNSVVYPEQTELLWETMNVMIAAAVELEYLLKGPYSQFTQTPTYAALENRLKNTGSDTPTMVMKEVGFV